MGGSGGGHEKACGAMVPKDKLEEFIDAIDMQVAIVDRIKYNQESSNICIRILRAFNTC